MIAGELLAPVRRATRLGTGRRAPAWPWVIAALLPFLVAAGWFVATRHLVLGSDQALLALDTTDARHLHQAVGPYSRMGWAHPGPAWYALLVPGFTLLGSSGAALVASALAVQALAAGLIVGTCADRRPGERPLLAAVLLLFVLRVPAQVWVHPWNPDALLLPTVLLLLLTARAASRAALAGVLVVGSFLVQTHIGTLPLVGAAVVVAAGVHLASGGGPRGGGRVAAALVGLAVLAWVPPLVQQLGAAPGRGNLAQIASYFLHGAKPGDERHTWGQALAAVGRMFGVPVYGWNPGTAPLAVATLPASVLLALVAQLLGTLLLLAAGVRWAHRRSVTLAVALLGAEAAAVVAAKAVTGPVYAYLLLWLTALPAVLAYGWLLLVVERLRPRLPPVRRPLPLRAVAAGAVAALVVATATAQVRAAAGEPDQPGVTAAMALLRGHVRGGVYLDLGSADAWPTATGIGLLLEQQGHPVRVDGTWARLFGRDRLATGREQTHVLLVPAWYAPQVHGVASLGTVATDAGPMAVLVGR